MLDRLYEHGPFLAVLSFLPPTTWYHVLRARQALKSALCSSALSLKELAPHFRWLLQGHSLATALTSVRHQHDLCSSAEEPCLQAAVVGLLFGLDVNGAEPVTGVTALMVAAEEGYARLCQLLLSRGADADELSRGGYTALEMCFAARYSCNSCYRSCCRCASRRSVVDELLPRTTKNLDRAWAGCLRMALQLDAYHEVVKSFAVLGKQNVNQEILSCDGRSDSLLGIALMRLADHERTSSDPEHEEVTHRYSVVKILLELKADPLRCGLHWTEGPRDLLAYARANSNDVATLELLIHSRQLASSACDAIAE
mmetsp:Transcript_64439/g.153756  ORF Transcript_64439/g.153756 Transcript_64439/m.153756 type:complete len:312 (+) Transcript_64439:182-1117(+)